MSQVNKLIEQASERNRIEVARRKWRSSQEIEEEKNGGAGMVEWMVV